MKKFFLLFFIVFFFFLSHLVYALPTGLVALWQGENNGEDSVGTNDLTL